ncbi:hypothetical protein G6F65_020285 [Rhizopus arrhizus]|nr:hypothetical protein G6F65_020285 [Rhizopus arrhizus]
MRRECITEDSKASAQAEAFFVDAFSAGQSRSNVRLLMHGRPKNPIWRSGRRAFSWHQTTSARVAVRSAASQLLRHRNNRPSRQRIRIRATRVGQLGADRLGNGEGGWQSKTLPSQSRLTHLRGTMRDRAKDGRPGRTATRRACPLGPENHGGIRLWLDCQKYRHRPQRHRSDAA